MPSPENLEQSIAAVLDAFIEKHLPELREQLRDELVRTVDATAAPAPSTSEALNTALYMICGARSQAEILQNLLFGTASFAPRAAVLVVKGERLSGWRGRGFEAPDRLRELALEARGEANWKRALAMQSATSGKVESLSEALARPFFDCLGAPHDGAGYLMPLLVRDRPVGALYVDAGSDEKPLDLSALDLLARTTGMYVELSATRQRPAAAAAAASSGTLRSEEEIAASAAAMAEPEMAAVSELAAAAVAAPAVEEPAAFESPAAAGPVAPAPAAFSLTGPDFSAIPETDHDIHKKAFRAAKVMVDELVLYNKDKIEEAKAQRDIYAAIGEDIDKCRSTYQKRFGSTAAGKVDYFHQHLLHRLAQGDLSVLGSQYPGPLV